MAWIGIARAMNWELPVAEWLKELWGQTVARLQSEEGSIIGISFAPSLHD
jgi:hypothetical protein